MAPDYLWLAQLNSNKIILLLRMTRGMRAQLATGLVFFIEIHQKSASRKALIKNTHHCAKHGPAQQAPVSMIPVQKISNIQH